MSKVKAKMRVRCEVEVDVDVWDGDTNFDALRQQVFEEGLHRLKHLSPKLTVVGNVKVLAVLLEDAQ